MGKEQISKAEIARIVKLRMTGHSLPEICKSVGRGSSTVHKYAKSVAILPRYKDVLKQKQGGSKNRSRVLWERSRFEARKLLDRIGKKEKYLVLAALYWGEGDKKDLSLINGDPELIRTFVACLKGIGIENNEFRISIRIYENINIERARRYWIRICGVRGLKISSVNILKGKKLGKLPFGMCRVRVAKGGQYFKLIMSMVDIIKSEIV